MRIRAVGLVLMLLLSACRNHYEAPANPADTILTKTTPSIPVDSTSLLKDTNGLVMDRSQIRSQEHKALLKRFDPLDVLKTYDDFWPLRKSTLSESEVNTFLANHKITIAELKAILEEGDKLGWAEEKKSKEGAH